LAHQVCLRRRVDTRVPHLFRVNYANLRGTMYIGYTTRIVQNVAPSSVTPRVETETFADW